MKRKKSKLIPLGGITQTMEPMLDMLTDDHKLQWHEVLALVHAWLQTHAPQGQEVYLDNSHPVYYYGHKDGIK